MPEFKVKAMATVAVETTVDADTLEEAEEIVDDWDVSDFGFDLSNADVDLVEVTG